MLPVFDHIPHTSHCRFEDTVVHWDSYIDHSDDICFHRKEVVEVVEVVEQILSLPCQHLYHDVHHGQNAPVQGPRGLFWGDFRILRKGDGDSFFAESCPENTSERGCWVISEIQSFSKRYVLRLQSLHTRWLQKRKFTVMCLVTVACHTCNVSRTYRLVGTIVDPATSYPLCSTMSKQFQFKLVLLGMQLRFDLLETKSCI